MSSLALDRTIPVNPPKENKKINPVTHKSLTLSLIKFKGRPCNVDNQLKIFIPVGTAITMVALVK